MNSRMKRGPGSKLAFVGCIALLLMAASCSTYQATVDTRGADEAKIKELDAQWSKTAVANDVDGTVSYYADDAYLLAPNAPIASGKPAIRAVWASMLSPEVTVSWQVSKVEVARSGDLAYLMGTYQVVPKDPKSKIPADKGKLVEVWKKQADGNWKTVADIFNTDLPAAAPVEVKKK